jgi:hypothetical protein
MQRAMSGTKTDLSFINQNIAALCHERTQAQKKQHEFRHCPRDSRHDAWVVELRDIEERRRQLIHEQKLIFKRSMDCGVKVGGMCI